MELEENPAGPAAPGRSHSGPPAPGRVQPAAARAADVDDIQLVPQPEQPESEQHEIAPRGEDGQADGSITITLKEFITGHTFQVSIDPNADIAALKRLIHEEHDGAAEPDGQRLVLGCGVRRPLRRR